MSRRSALEVAEQRAATARARLAAMRAERALEVEKRTYDAASNSNGRPRRGKSQSGDAVMHHAGATLRNWARHLDENLDLAVGVLDNLVDRIVGRGIGIEPAVETGGGQMAERFNADLARAWRDWSRESCESTGELTFNEAQRLVCRTWFRDGEVLINHIEGRGFDHGSDVPYSLELIEPDYLPFERIEPARGNQGVIIHGVEKNQQRRPVAFHLYEDHPGSTGVGTLAKMNTRRVSAAQITHVKRTRRLGQTRGVSCFAPVLQRLEDIKDYEESERIAARVAASFTAFIRKSSDDPTIREFDAAGNRLMEMQAGMIFDDLLPGEEIGSISSDRPNPNLGAYRLDQLRAVASGTGTAASSISKNYAGTYSSQRQEMVESLPGYNAARDYFIDHVLSKIWRRFVSLAILSGRLSLAGINPATLFDAIYIHPAMPWIDPAKESAADKTAIEIGIKSRHQIIRDRGGDPRVVDKQIQADLFEPASATPPAADPQPNQDEAAA